MAIPWIYYVGAVSQAVPPIAGLRYGSSLPPARKWIVLWAAILLATDAISLPLALNKLNNMWVGYLFGPLEVAAALMGLSLWHGKPNMRLVFRRTIPVFIVVWGILVLFVENSDSFSLISGPLKSILLLTAAVLTLLTLIASTHELLSRQAWFWICIGLALKYGSDTALEPISRILMESTPHLVSVAHQVKSVVDGVASLIIAGGILCPIPPLRASSGPISPASSPSASSSSRLAPPW